MPIRVARACRPCCYGSISAQETLKGRDAQHPNSTIIDVALSTHESGSSAEGR